MENDIATHKYHHHTRIWQMGQTTAIAYSSACTNESDGGKQTVISFSTNAGATWGSPVLAVPSQSAWTNGYGVNRDTFIVYPRNWQYTNGTNWLIAAVESFDSSVRIVGEALFALPVFTNGTVGTLMRISTNTYSALDGKTTPTFSQALHDLLMPYSIVYGCWGGTRPGATPDSEWIGWAIKYTPWVNYYVEPNTFSADGSTTNLYRIWRVVSQYATNNLYLEQQRSTNSGANWSDWQQTGIPNTPAETVGRRLTDGRFVIVGNPQMYIQDVSIWRDPLFCAISDVNSTTITNVYAVRQGDSGTPIYPFVSGKGGGAQYPDCIQVGDYLYVSYSLHKESVGFSRFMIPSNRRILATNLSVETFVIGN